MRPPPPRARKPTTTSSDDAEAAPPIGKTYAVPPWGGPPSAEFHVDVVKGGVVEWTKRLLSQMHDMPGRHSSVSTTSGENVVAETV